MMISYVPIKISCGYDFVSCIVNGRTYVWGANSNYELGLGDNRGRNIPHCLLLDNIVKTKTGKCHMFAFSNFGTLYGWGKIPECNSLNITQSRLITMPHKFDVPSIKIKTNFQNDIIVTINKNNVCLSGYLFTEHMTSYYVDNVMKIKCGVEHIIFLRKDGTLCSTGSNFYGQLGVGKKNGGKVIEEIPLTNVITMACGNNFTVALVSRRFHSRQGAKSGDSGQTFNDEIYGWGENAYGQLGLGDKFDRFVPHKVILSTESNPTIRSISCGLNYTMILTGLDEIYVWGKNYRGQLGTGVGEDRYMPQKLYLSGVMRIYCGVAFSMAVTNSNKIYTWGNNAEGQLGLGDNDDRYVPTEIQFKF